MLENHKSIEELYLSSEFANEEKKAAANYASWDLTPRQICDLELLLNGGFSPLKGCLLYTSPSPRDGLLSRMPSSA